MSVAGLKFGAERLTSAPAETKSGSYIYDGNPQSFHDWEFRTLLRIRLFEESHPEEVVASNTQKSSKPGKVGPRSTEQFVAEPEGDEDEFPFPERERSRPYSMQEDPEESASRTGKSETSQAFQAKRRQDLATLVNKIVEGLRGDAFLVARDLGHEVLMQPKGLETLISRIRANVFPRATEEARELFRAGQRQGGVLSRQSGESMLSYTSRRRRWWRLLVELDPSLQLSEEMRSELMLELSGISRQEVLVIKSCALSLSFEHIAEVLVKHYSSTHLKEGSRSWNPTSQSKHLMNYASKGKGKGKPRYYSTGYVGLESEWKYDDPNDWPTCDADYWDDETPYTGLVAEGDYGDDEQDSTQHVEYEESNDYEYVEGIEDQDALALNAIVELEGADEKTVGEAIQLQLAAYAAFGKAKGKGFGKFKGKGKGKGKVIKSHLSIEQRRQKLSELKKNSKCLRCGGKGHWAGDPECKFPGRQKPQGQSNPQGNSKPTAHYGWSDSSSDDGMVIPPSAASSSKPVANMAVRSGARPKSVPKAVAKSRVKDEALVRSDGEVVFYSSEGMRPLGSDTVFPSGEFKGKTYWFVLHKNTDHYHWASKLTNRSKVLDDYVKYVDQYFRVDGPTVILRDTPIQPPPIATGSRGPKPSAKKVPPNPPLQKCSVCKDFSHRGSTAYTIRSTCLDCGHATTERRNEVPRFTFEDCPHTDVDHRGSSRTVHRTYCKMCQEFIDEMPLEQHQHRVQIAKSVEEAPLETVDLIENIATSTVVEPFGHLELQQIISSFGRYVSSEAESEEMDGRQLHLILESVISEQLGARYEDPVGDAVRMGLRDPDAMGYVAISVGYEGTACDPEDLVMSDGLVKIEQPSMDMYGDDHDHVFAVLDEGCNTTCHSRRWAEMAEGRLKKRGLTFPFTDEVSPKKFTGLGAGNTGTDGVRAFPFALALTDPVGGRQIVNGIFHSHQLSSGSAPLLISLHAQAHLKLTKDMSTGTIMIGTNILPTHRCSKTGLIMINLTEGIDISNLAKCHRPLRDSPLVLSVLDSEGAAFAGTVEMASAVHGSVRLTQSRGQAVEGERRDITELFPDVRVLVTTRGERFGNPPRCDDRRVLTLDCRCFHDPDGGVLRGHVGTHLGVISGMIKSSCKTVRELAETAMDFVNECGNRRCWIDLVCTSGRHRSVGMSVVLGVVLQESQVDHRTVHLHSYQWKHMKCGGRCQQCGLRDLKGLLQVVADVLPRGAVRNEPVVIQDEPASSSSSRPSLTPDLREIIQDLASSVRVLTDRVERVEKGDRSRSRHGSKDGPKEPPFPPPGRSATPRPSSRRPPSPPQSPRARASDGQPFNRVFNPGALSQSELQAWVEGKEHDYLTWYGSESAAQNYAVGVRINVKVRGSVRWDTVKHPKDMASWIKTSFARRRGTDQWYLVASRVPMNQQTVLADVLDGDGDEGHMDLIVFAQPGDHGSGEKKKQEFCPPIPPKPRRNVAWKDDSYDQPPGNWDRSPAVVLKGNGKSLDIDDTKSLGIDDTKSLGIESDVEETPNSKRDCVSPHVS